MPIYEYDCKECGERFETLVRRAGESVSCPKCGAADVEKRFSVFSAGKSTGSGGGAPPAPA